MMWPPSLLGFRIQSPTRDFWIWLPLFLLWPLVVLAALVMLPLILLTSLVLWPTGWGRTLLFTGPWLFRMFCALRGLVIDVKSGTSWLYFAVK